ncbi:MAG: YggS family pyridoxal phosphate-dependent enzyme [Comamonas sp.]|jgi:PLP dependent protein|nr:YggS family pyridoxal phosphate-dependent enzyme [Comamonas sp.]
MTMIANQLRTVQAQIAAAAQFAGRVPASVRLLAVSKTFPAEAVRAAALAGQHDFGENYIQEGVEKIVALQAMPDLPALTWHCIGSIQSNKTRLVAEYFDWVHTVDRLKIAERLSQQRPAHLPPLQVCIQVNADGGATKAGCSPAEAAALAHQVAQLPRLQLRGVMSIPDPLPDAAAMLAVHRRVVALFEALRQQSGLEQLDTVSLGMTADLDSAIAAGSTMVRVGSGIFGARDYVSRNVAP